MTQSVVSWILIAVITTAIVRDRLELIELRKKLLELATKLSKTRHVQEIELRCDNSQAIASLEEVGRVIDKTNAQLTEIERRARVH
jgi:hypothetical protein